MTLAGNNNKSANVNTRGRSTHMVAKTTYATVDGQKCEKSGTGLDWSDTVNYCEVIFLIFHIKGSIHAEKDEEEAYLVIVLIYQHNKASIGGHYVTWGWHLEAKSFLCDRTVIAPCSGKCIPLAVQRWYTPAKTMFRHILPLNDLSVTLLLFQTGSWWFIIYLNYVPLDPVVWSVTFTMSEI